jgi:hypothetical protein
MVAGSVPSDDLGSILVRCRREPSKVAWGWETRELLNDHSQISPAQLLYGKYLSLPWNAADYVYRRRSESDW